MSLLTLENVATAYDTPQGRFRALEGVSFSVAKGETVGLVGESGCGKSTLGKTLMRLVPSDEGSIRLDGAEISQAQGRALMPVRRKLQMIFQDPFASLNPRHRIRRILTGPLKIHGVASRAERNRIAEEIVQRVGLPGDALDRYPHEFSGGQRQRIGIARALILRPQMIVCDEPVSALDLSIQAQIINLLAQLKAEYGLSYLFISHDLSVVRYFTDRVLVMYLGRIVESGPTRDVWNNPRHPYTRALIDALPEADRPREAAPLAGDLPGVQNLPGGCRFHPRCPYATDLCCRSEPLIDAKGGTHGFACHNPLPLKA
ncbi:ABC transporter ATP-binding protein [Paracoccus laeviglucosivorans]|uniref:Peptide/nickel transport system ATP-binding protein n=1 Tax=Paracoccus laeviglucosivorans TaxID=1197861 RepID=A0A521ESF2_9RHOB|nr:ABC transporter ATP-binding protein [Paracoccus laeviglucosivorans]SMO86834.1 peptide/nickel transport system ATP-binding protein [Paracoccus laeviglucosivorans]